MCRFSRFGAALGTLAVSIAVPLAAQQPWIPREVLQQTDRVRVIKGGRVDTVTGDRPVPIKRGEVVVVPGPGQTTIDSTPGDSTRHVDLPNRYWVLGRGGETLTLRVRVGFSGRGLRYDRTLGAFVGELIIGLEDSLRPREQISLSAPILVQVTGGADAFEPSDFSIQHTNLPYQRIRVRADEPADTMIHVVVQPTFDPTGVRTPIPVQPPLEVSASHPRIQGFGLQTATVRVVMSNPPEGAKVMLRSKGGQLDQDTVSRSAGGLAVTRLRSGGIGKDTVRAQLGHLVGHFTAVDYSFPWPFLIAAVLGGALGAFIRGRRQASKEKSRRARSKDIDARR